MSSQLSPIRLRVLMLLGTLQLGGAERSVVTLIPRLEASGVGASLCTLTSTRDSYLADEAQRLGVVRHDLGARGLSDPAALARLVALLRRVRPDVLHAQDYNGVLVGALAGRLTGVPFIATRHVLVQATGSRREHLKSMTVDLLLRHAAGRVVSVSSHLGRHLVDNLHIPERRVSVVHNGVDVDAFDLAIGRSEARRRLGWPERPTVAMIAAFHPRKGHEVLFDALPALKARVPDVRVVLAGSGPLDDRIRARASALEEVDVLGPREDVALILRASDVVVLPSWTEGFPITLLEAGAAGRPSVATDVVGVSEIVRDGVTGYLVGSGDGSRLAARLADVLLDRELAEAMGQAARARVREHFSLDHQAEATSAVYRSIAGHR